MVGTSYAEPSDLIHPTADWFAMARPYTMPNATEVVDLGTLGDQTHLQLVDDPVRPEKLRACAPLLNEAVSTVVDVPGPLPAATEVRAER